MTIAESEHAGLDGPFVALTFVGELDQGVVNLEGMGGEVFVEDVGQATRCNVRFGRICEQALTEKASVALIADIAEEYQRTNESPR